MASVGMAPDDLKYTDGTNIDETSKPVVGYPDRFHALVSNCLHLGDPMLKTAQMVMLSAIAYFFSTTATMASSDSTAASVASAGSTNTIETLKEEANHAFWNHDYKTAKADLQKLLPQLKSEDSLHTRALVNLAICDAQEENMSDAMKTAEQALKHAAPDSLNFADAQLVKARALYLLGKIEPAKAAYLKATELAERHIGRWNPDLASFYEGLAACAVSKGDWIEAEKAYKKVAQFDFLKYGSDSTQMAWALLSLRVAESKLHKDALEEELYKKVFWNFRHQNEIRILQENKDYPDQEHFRKALRQQMYGYKNGYANENMAMPFVKEGIPPEVLAGSAKSREHTFDNWYRHRTGRDRAPGLGFFDPNQKLKGMIVAVHGLGLHHGAFKPFAEKIQHEGYAVIAFDVRGFGSYRNDEVLQRVDLLGAVEDLTRILKELKYDYPDTPIILLGESMGGAIVLRLAATHPQLVDAVISSVPSGSRYKGRSAAIGVGLKLLTDKNKQFDMGTKVVEQATQKADLRDMWEGDPNVRMNFSAAELVNFQHFMSNNLQFAQKIDKTPVIIFQGYSDNLVKPMGTLAIYHAIKNKDKDMLFIGRAEHLIFEEGQLDPDVYNGVVGWINKHVKAEH